MSAQQISFFVKNFADYTMPNVVVTASQASSYITQIQRRSNLTGWMTTGSVDSDNTTVTVDFVDLVAMTDIILVKHSFKSFTIQYWDGAAYQDFSTPINPANCVDATSHFSFNSVQTTKVLLTILGTQVPNTEKKLSQFIATSLIGQLNGWPIIKAPTFDLNKRVTVMLSGKKKIEANTGGFACQLTVTTWSNSADLGVIETLYNSGEGFLVWLCGGDQTQFSSVRKGYRLEDVFFCKCEDNFKPEWSSGLYKSGLNIAMQLSEVSN